MVVVVGYGGLAGLAVGAAGGEMRLREWLKMIDENEVDGRSPDGAEDWYRAGREPFGGDHAEARRDFRHQAVHDRRRRADGAAFDEIDRRLAGKPAQQRP